MKMPARKGSRSARPRFLMCGWKARREEVRVTVPERAKPQTWRLVRMGDEREGARIGASPYDPVPRRGDLVKKVCRNVVYHIDIAR